MYKFNLKAVLTGSALVAMSLFATSANANEAVSSTNEDQIIDRLQQYSNESGQNSVNQVTSVNQLRDVAPTDWAYEALQSLVERYGCVAGYPNGTYRGNKSLSRYEFAAGLNACMNQIERLIASSQSVMREDLDKMQRLTQEFQAELATLGTRVDNLEGRTKFIEDHQFSTTTKLNGEVIFALTDSFGSNDNTQTTLGDRYRLTFNTSFNGNDKLVTRIAGGNLSAITNSTSGGAEGTQTFNLYSGSNNDAQVDWAAYYFPIKTGKSELNNYIAAFGGIHSDYVNTLNPYFEDFDGGNGALSTFASESPIYRIGGGAGLGTSYKFGKSSNITLGYLAGNANNSNQGNGLFDGNYAALGQVNFGLGDNLNLGLTYVNAYFDAATPTFNGGGSNAIVGTNLANSIGSSRQTNTYGAEVSWKLSDSVNLSGFVAYQDVDFKSGARAGLDDEVWTYGGGIAFPDLGKEGNVLGIFAGVQPYLGSAVNSSGGGVPLHVEAFYKYKLNDNISITPGVVWLSNPNQNENNNDEVIGTLRTTFTF
jgi:Carbohydrate-selective porin, OprB family/S-layer homology domain